MDHTFLSVADNTNSLAKGVGKKIKSIEIPPKGVDAVRDNGKPLTGHYSILLEWNAIDIPMGGMAGIPIF